MSSYRIVDAVYGPPLHEPLPDSYSHRLPQELQRRVGPQLEELLTAPLVLPGGSLNSIFGDPAPLLTKELRIAVTDSNNCVRVATFNECESIRFTSLEFLWKQVPASRNNSAIYPDSEHVTKKEMEWPILTGSLPFCSFDNNVETDIVIKEPSISPTPPPSASSLSSATPQKKSISKEGYCYIDLITRRGIPLSEPNQKDKGNQSTKSSSVCDTKRSRSSSFSLPSASRTAFKQTSHNSPQINTSLSRTEAGVVPITRTFLFMDSRGYYVDREEEILMAVLDCLGFRERVASSVVSSAWHVVFYQAGACRAIHTDLPVFRGCSTRFLLGALEHSKQSLSVCGLVGRNDLSPRHFTEMVLPLSRVTVLDLSRCTSLTSECFVSMAKSKFPLLEVLYLKEIPALDDQAVTLLANTFSNLTCFDISYCPKLTGKCIREVGIALPMLRMFNISDLRNQFNGDDLYYLLNNAGANNLHTISLRQCSAITNLGKEDEASMQETGQSSLKRSASYSSSPHSLSSNCSMKRSSSFSSSFSSRGVEDVYCLRPNPTPLSPLTCINLSGCHSLSDSSLEPLSSATHLRYFNASYCHRLSDHTLTLLASFASQLEHLDLTCLPLLTNSGIKACCGQMTKLRSLGLGHCRQLTSDVVTLFIMQTPNLSELRLEYCKKIDARNFLKGIEPSIETSSSCNSFEGTIQTFPKLDLIDLRGCGGISSHMAAAFGVGSQSSKLGVEGFTERRPGFLRRLPPKMPLPVPQETLSKL